jgi:serine/threonine-protein kinase
MTSLADDALAQALADRYDLEREIGRGGMATVYLAHDRKHGRRVAIKVLNRELATPFGADRFLREVHLVAQLQHPHIIPLFDSGQAAGLLYFVMPFVEGESLRELLRREGTLTLERSVRLLRQIADALDYAHARGVVHRDLKPDNVLLVGGQATLADFGIARAMDGSERDSLTLAGIRLGTPLYMSPEQAAGDPGIDARSDIYSLGCVCYEMLAGRPPFGGATNMAVLSQHIATAPPPLTGARETLPDGVSDAVARALAKDPGSRFERADTLVAALEDALSRQRAPSVTDARLRALEQRRVARQAVLVLDFANIAGAADADWLATGIAESIRSDLARIADVRIVPLDPGARRRAQEAPPGQTIDSENALAIGQSAGAQWVVWGGFQKLGPNVRLIASVGDVSQRRTFPVEKVDGPIDSILQLQDRVVTAVAGVLQIQLTSAERERIHRPETTRLTAYEHYARGFRAYLQFGKESAKIAERHYRAAVEADPDYAAAYAGLGALHIPMYIASGSRDVLEDGTRFLERAIALDPGLAESYGWLTYMLVRQHRFGDAERAARRAIELEPESFTSWYMLGLARAAGALTTYRLADLARAVPPLLRTVSIRPEHHAAYQVLGSLYLVRGTYGHAVATIDAALRRELTEPTLRFIGARVERAVLHLGVGEVDQATALLDRALERYDGSDHVYAEAMTAHTRWARGRVAELAGDDQLALDEYRRAREIAEANPHRISIGAHWVKSSARSAGVLHRLGRDGEARRMLGEAQRVFATRERFVWTWFVGASDADVLYELAASHAAMGRDAEAVELLKRAADAGWADQTRLRHDPAFTTLRDSTEVIRICSDAAGRVELPPPVGAGGLA